ncbi:hypothetical protein E4U58_003762 [Claviceps cyperi]|nr:hypothetical protein E4U58_003762 [Claviceps cyperi]
MANGMPVAQKNGVACKSLCFSAKALISYAAPTNHFAISPSITQVTQQTLCASPGVRGRVLGTITTSKSPMPPNSLRKERQSPPDAYRKGYSPATVPRATLTLSREVRLQQDKTRMDSGTRDLLRLCQPDERTDGVTGIPKWQALSEKDGSLIGSKHVNAPVSEQLYASRYAQPIRLRGCAATHKVSEVQMYHVLKLTAIPFSVDMLISTPYGVQIGLLDRRVSVLTPTSRTGAFSPTPER